ncbi:MAG: aa3-type cytochrome c oxidase subunit IV [Hyphomicrobiales bacterium]|nr:aa3-type cytochrome c oxidase subunit IV [Hyphomicrobiales bacterium]
MSVDMDGGNPNMDYEAHKGTYAFFIKLVKYGTAAVVAILIGMAVFLL